MFIVDILGGGTADPDIGRILIQKKHLHQFRRLEPVTGKIHPHARKRRHSRDILAGVMGHAQGAVTDAAADADQGHIGVGIGHVHLGLLVTSGRQEACRGRCKNFLSHGRQPCGHRDQILLRDAEFHKLLRKSVRKGSQGGASPGIGTGYHNVPVLLCRSKQHIADCLSIGYGIHASTSSNSAFACRYCSSVMTP